MTRKPASPHHSVRGVVHSYWIQQRESRLKRQAASPKRQAASKKEFDKPIDLWDKVI